MSPARVRRFDAQLDWVPIVGVLPGSLGVTDPRGGTSNWTMVTDGSERGAVVRRESLLSAPRTPVAVFGASAPVSGLVPSVSGD